MQRITAHRYVEPVAAALALLPAGITDRIRHVDLFTADPVFADLHRYTVIDDLPGVPPRSYRDTPHVVYPHHQQHMPAARRATTIVAQTVVSVATVVHELGHVLHERLRFEPQLTPINWYARMNRHEAFAEAFAAWALPFGHGYGEDKDRLYDLDRGAVALFDALAAE